MFRPPSWPQIESNDKNFAEGGVLPSRLRVSSAILYACDAVPRPYGRRGKVMNPVHLSVQRVMEIAVDESVRAGIWQLHVAHGTELLLDAVRCRLVPEQLQQAGAGQAAEALVAWKLLLAEEASRTDRAIDWGSDAELP